MGSKNSFSSVVSVKQVTLWHSIVT